MVVLLAASVVLLATMAAALLHWNIVDYTVLHLVSRVTHRSWILDLTMQDLGMTTISNVVVVSMIWYVWFQNQEARYRSILLAGSIASFAAGVLSRGMQLALPTHLRPLHDASLHFVIPYGVNPDTLNHWSSFPSDHAATFFGLATVVFVANRRAGWLAYAIAFQMSLSRVYMGLHSPTDITAGAALGILMVLLVSKLFELRPSLGLRLSDIQPSRRALYYAACVYVSFGCATLFQDYRDVASQYHAAAQHLIHEKTRDGALPSSMRHGPAEKPAVTRG